MKITINNYGMNMSTLKSIWAVVAGFLTVVVLSVGSDFILEASGFFPPQSEPEAYVWWMLLIALIYRSIYTVAGGYLTAMLAPERPMHHVFILGILGAVGGILGVIVGWDLSQNWYPIALAVTAFPLVWLGGKLRSRPHGAAGEVTTI